MSLRSIAISELAMHTEDLDALKDAWNAQTPQKPWESLGMEEIIQFAQERMSARIHGEVSCSYHVTSGDLDVMVEAGGNATPLEIAMLALERNYPPTLGLLTEIEGGKYVGKDVTYVSTVEVCKRLGRFSPFR